MQSLKQLCLLKIKYISPIHYDLYEDFTIFNKNKMLKEFIEKTHRLYFEINVRFSHCYMYSSFYSNKLEYYNGCKMDFHICRDSNNYFGLKPSRNCDFNMLNKEYHVLFANIKKKIFNRTYDEMTRDDYFIYRCDVDHVCPV